MYGFGSGLIWFRDVKCIGRELSLFECKIMFCVCLGCYYSSDVGVVCFGLVCGELLIN